MRAYKSPLEEEFFDAKVTLFLNRENYIPFTKKVNTHLPSSQDARHFGVSLKIGKEIGLEKNV
jgi:hypothetical protein